MVKIGIIGGSGLGAALAGVSDVTRHDVSTPFGPPSDAVLETHWDGLPVLLLSRHGPGHTLHPSAVPFRANIFALKQLGCTHILASGAVGSLRDEMRPRDLVLCDQVIDKTCKRASTFYEHAAVHVELAEPFCPVLRQVLTEAVSDESSLKLSAVEGSGSVVAPSPSPQSTDVVDASRQLPAVVHTRGCYVCMEGPAFSTRAESLMHRLWGGELIGMTAMPEAKLAREAEIPYALIALVTDYDCWKLKDPADPAVSTSTGEASAPETDPAATLLSEIIANLHTASDNAMRLIRAALRRIASDPSPLQRCPASNALKLAIWSDKSRIDRREVQRLWPLWGRYFE